MAEKDEGLSLPKATVTKLIKEMLPSDVKCANDTRDLIVECCVEFIHLISSEANEISAKESKKTITGDHVIQALKTLGFEKYLKEVSAVYEQHKTESAEKPRGTKKLEDLGIPKEQLLQEQQRLFAQARNSLANSQERAPTAITTTTTTTATSPASTSTPPPPATTQTIVEYDEVMDEDEDEKEL